MDNFTAILALMSPIMGYVRAKKQHIQMNLSKLLNHAGISAGTPSFLIAPLTPYPIGTKMLKSHLFTQSYSPSSVPSIFP